jgi:hypothetical protein
MESAQVEDPIEELITDLEEGENVEGADPADDSDSDYGDEDLSPDVDC